MLHLTLLRNKIMIFKEIPYSRNSITRERMSDVARNSRVDIIDRQGETKYNALVGASAFSPCVSIELYNRGIDTGLSIFFLLLISLYFM